MPDLLAGNVLLVNERLLRHHEAALVLVVDGKEEHVAQPDPPHLQPGPKLT